MAKKSTISLPALSPRSHTTTSFPAFESRFCLSTCAARQPHVTALAPIQYVMCNYGVQCKFSATPRRRGRVSSEKHSGCLIFCRQCRRRARLAELPGIIQEENKNTCLLLFFFRISQQRHALYSLDSYLPNLCFLECSENIPRAATTRPTRHSHPRNNTPPRRGINIPFPTLASIL